MQNDRCKVRIPSGFLFLEISFLFLKLLNQKLQALRQNGTVSLNRNEKHKPRIGTRNSSFLSATNYLCFFRLLSPHHRAGVSSKLPQLRTYYKIFKHRKESRGKSRSTLLTSAIKVLSISPKEHRKQFSPQNSPIKSIFNVHFPGY